MPRGAYTAKQDRKAEHIEEGYEKRGVSKKEAEQPRVGDGQQAGRRRQQRPATAVRRAAAPPPRRVGRRAAAMPPDKRYHLSGARRLRSK